MRRFITLGIAILTMVLLTQCVEKTSEPFIEPLGDTISLNDTVSMRVGDKVMVLPDGFEMGFDRIIEDSRCPYEYFCLDPGKGVIRLWLRKQGTDTIHVNTGLRLSDHAFNEHLLIPADTLGCRFSLVALFPYPVDFDPIPQDEYLARIRVTRFNNDISLVDSVIISDQPPDSIELDHFELKDIYISGDDIHVLIEHSGGCEVHDFRLVMSPPVFAESNPVQADLYLRHDANGDVCRMLIQRDLTFNLRPIARLYMDMYGHMDPIRINVHYYRDSYGRARSDIYFPSN